MGSPKSWAIAEINPCAVRGQWTTSPTELHLGSPSDSCKEPEIPPSPESLLGLMSESGIPYMQVLLFYFHV